ncbi:MAG: type I-E CRISPR-associated protein Cas6/Cse3/CasE [Candidatus Competibacteraceae bacterium]|nr:type I-E CRISPR-associated protein Cas6/Cse3/CasE [Candidatus Competibacteraceae bacterium]
MSAITQSASVTRGYFSRIELHDSADARVFVARFGLEGYGLHQALWRLFVTDPGIQRDFLYRVIDDAERPAFYVVSARPPVANSRVWRVRSRDYKPCLRAGDRLAFSLRANPTVKRASAPGARSVRHDVVMDAHQRGMAPDPTGGLYDQPGLAWLTPRSAAAGFRVEKTRIDGYRRHQLYKRGGSPIVFSTLDFEGVLTVTEPTAFCRSLMSGLGPAKAFGCGLLLVRRV